MDTELAETLFEELRGDLVGGWQVQDLISHGKSAVVFKAASADREIALKVFDKQLVARYGEETQLSRIKRELTLRDKKHKHLVEIYDGGRCDKTGLLFVAMQRIRGKPLSKVLCDIRRKQIRRLISQVASAARFLEELGLAHRDIKPDNIVYSENTGDVTLLDLGVLRPIDSISAMTDGDPKLPFIGTHRYSPQEFLLRKEEDSPEGWRAVTFYQLGGVLHDLLERRPLFGSQTEIARLVNAVLNSQPEFSATDVPTDLVRLSKCCLHKNPLVRLRLVSWQDFTSLNRQEDSGITAKDRVRALLANVPELNRRDWHEKRNVKNVRNRVIRDLERSIRQWCVSETLLPPVEIRELTTFKLTTGALHIHFRPDQSRQLAHHIQLWVGLDLVDAETELVELTCCARISLSQDLPEPSDSIRIFAGAFDSTPVSKRIGHIVYNLLEMALANLSPDGPIELESILQVADLDNE